MSKERIEYNTAPMSSRLIAFIVDLIVAVVIDIIMWVGIELEHEIIYRTFDWYYREWIPYIVLVMYFVGLAAYYVLMSSLTDGQTLGKILTGIRVLSDDNESFKALKLTQRLKIHTKRLILLRSGTKVVKEKDPEVTGL
ncbi:MAG: RDD family protein [Candidatus Hodarchaeales archaeon]|jgi:uncharacterized RDD family membrane protein YckC